MGRLGGVSVSAADPQRVYAVIESEEGGYTVPMMRRQLDPDQ